MTLHEAIEKILLEAEKPLSTQAIADKINATRLYSRKDEKIITKSQIQARVRQYNKLFYNINDLIVPYSDLSWKEILTTYWYIADILKGLYSISELQFVIASLFYYKRLRDLEVRHKEYGSKALNFPLRFLANESEPHEKNYLIRDDLIAAEYGRIQSKIGFDKEFEILNLVNKLETNKYSDEAFGNIFEYLLHFNSLDSSKSPISYTPQSLRELMVSLLNPLPSKTVYDPVAGTGGLLVEALHLTNNNLRIKATEINGRVALLNFMNLEMHGFLNPQINVGNCFDEFLSDETYDYVIGDLPIDGIINAKELYNISKQWNIDVTSSAKSFSAIVLFVLSKLNSNGKAVITVSESFLFKKGKEKLVRELLIGGDVIETIVGLPYGALRPNTDAKAALIVLNKSKSILLKNKIKFIQALTFGGDRQSIDLNTDEVAFLNSQFESSKQMQIVENKNLLKDANLSPQAYNVEFYLAQKMFEEGNGKKLGDLVQIKSGINIDKIDSDSDGDVPFIKIEDLSKDVLNIYLIKAELHSRIRYTQKYSKYLVSEECILIARIGDNLKPTYFKPQEDFRNILVHNGVYILTPKSDTINLEYLYYQLNSSFVLEQATKLSLGAVMPYISISGLKEILIPYMDLNSQLSFVNSQKANIISTERAKIEKKIEALGYKEEKIQAESDIVRTLVHQLRPTLLNIDIEVRNLKRIVDNNELNNFKEYTDEYAVGNDNEIEHLILPPVNYSVQDLLNKVQLDTLQLNEMLTTVNKIMSFKLNVGDMEKVNLLTFFNEYIGRKNMEFIDKFSIGISGENIIAQINKASFQELIDQLLINAQYHAFAGFREDITLNKIQFNIRSSKDQDRKIAIIEYQNNGRPFSLSEKDFKSPFHKSQSSKGSGIGGNYIYRIIQAHRGEIIIRSNQKHGFTLLIEIPLTQNIENE